MNHVKLSFSIVKHLWICVQCFICTDSWNLEIFSGYANEVGEAFRSFIPRSLVQASYGVASFYALADATLKCHTATVCSI